MIKEWSDIAWNEYEFFQNEDRKILRKINNLIKDIERNGESVGIGGPEPLKYEWTGYYSRKIDKKNRLIYKINESGHLDIASCKGHYDDK